MARRTIWWRALALVAGLIAVPAVVVSAAAGPAAADLPTTGAVAAPGPLGSVGLIGDSVSQGTLPWLGGDLATKGFGPIRLYAAPGVRIPPNPTVVNGLPTIRAWRAEGFDPLVWIVGLGADDVGFTTNDRAAATALIRTMLDEIGAGHEIVWANVYHGWHPDWMAAWNGALDDLAKVYPNLHVWDFGSIARAHPEWVVGDLVHLTPDGYRQRSSLLADVVATKAGAAAKANAPDASTAAARGPSGFTPLAPVRVLDTRSAGGRLPAGGVYTVDVSGAVPADAVAAAVNLTVDGASAPGFLTAWDCDPKRPFVSSLNYTAGHPRGAQAIVNLDRGKFCVYSLAATDLIVDVSGAFGPSGAQKFTPLTPNRIADTRTAARPAAGQPLKVHAADPGTAAAAINLTAVGADLDGFLTAYPCGGSVPVVSNVNHPAAVPTANLAIVPLDAHGDLCVFAQRQVDVVVDLLGTFGASGLRYQPADAVRLLDTRAGTGGWLGALSPLQRLDLPGSSVRGLPAGAKAVVGTVTATAAATPGFATAWPCAADRPGTSSLNFLAGENVANSAIVAVGGDRSVCLTSSARGYLLFDLTGWFTS